MLFRCFLLALAAAVALSLLGSTGFFQLCVKPPLPVFLKSVGAKAVVNRVLWLLTQQASYRVAVCLASQGRGFVKAQRPALWLTKLFFTFISQHLTLVRPWAHFWWRVTLLQALSPARLRRHSGYPAFGTSAARFDIYRRALWLRPLFFLLGHAKRYLSFFATSLSALFCFLFDSSYRVLHFFFFTTFARWEKPTPTPLRGLSLMNQLTFFEFAYLNLSVWRTPSLRVTCWSLEQYALALIGFWQQRDLAFWFRRNFLVHPGWVGRSSLSLLSIKVRLLGLSGVTTEPNEHALIAYSRRLLVQRVYYRGCVIVATLGFLFLSCVHVVYFLLSWLWRFPVFVLLRLVIRGQTLLHLWWCLPWLIRLRTLLRYLSLMALAWCEWKCHRSLISLICLLPLLTIFFLPLSLAIGSYALLLPYRQLLRLSLCLTLQARRLSFFLQSALVPLFMGPYLSYPRVFFSVRTVLGFLTWRHTAASAPLVAFVKLTPLFSHASFFFWGFVYSAAVKVRLYGLFFMAVDVTLYIKLALMRCLQVFWFYGLVAALFRGLWYYCYVGASYTQTFAAALLSLYLNFFFFAIANFLISAKLASWRLRTYAVELSQLPYQSLAVTDTLTLLVLNFFLRCLLRVKLCNPVYAGYHSFFVGKARSRYVIAVLRFQFFCLMAKHTLGSTSPSLRTLSFFFVHGCGELRVVVKKTCFAFFMLSVVKLTQFRQPSFLKGLRWASSLCLATLLWLQDFVLDGFEEEIWPYCLRFYQDAVLILTSPQLARRCLHLRYCRTFWPLFSLELALRFRLQGWFFNFFFFLSVLFCTSVGFLLLCSCFTELYLTLLSFSLFALTGFFFLCCLHVHWLFLSCLSVFIFKVLTRSCVQVKRTTFALVTCFYAVKLLGFVGYVVLFLTQVSSIPLSSDMTAQPTYALDSVFKAICFARFVVSASFCYESLGYLGLLPGFLQPRLLKSFLLLVLTLLWTFRLNRQVANLIESRLPSGRPFAKGRVGNLSFFYWLRLVFFVFSGWLFFITSLSLAALLLGGLSPWNLFFVLTQRSANYAESSQTFYFFCLLSWIFVTLTAALTAVLWHVYYAVVLNMPKASLAHRLTQRVLAGGVFLIVLVLWLLLVRALSTWGVYLSFVAGSKPLQDLLVSRYFYWVRALQFTYFFFTTLLASPLLLFGVFFRLQQRVRTQLLMTEMRAYAHLSFFVFYWVPGAAFYFFILSGSVIFVIAEITWLASYWYPSSAPLLQKAHITRANARTFYWTYRYASFSSLKKLKLQQWGLRRAALTSASLPHGVSKERSAWLKFLETGTKLRFRYNLYSWTWGYNANQVVRRRRIKHLHRLATLAERSWLLRRQAGICPAYAVNLPQRVKFPFMVKLSQANSLGGLTYAIKVPVALVSVPSPVRCSIGLKLFDLKLWKPISTGVVFLQHPPLLSRTNVPLFCLPAFSHLATLSSRLPPLPLQVLVLNPTCQLAVNELATRPCTYTSLVQLWRMNRLLTFTLTKKYSWSLPTFFSINRFFNNRSFLKELRVLLYGDEEDYENILELDYWALPTLRFNDFLALRRYSNWPSPSRVRTFATHEYQQQLLSTWSLTGQGLVPLAKAYSPLAYQAFKVCPWPARQALPPFSMPKLEFAAWSPIFPRLLTLKNAELTGAFIKFQRAFKGARGTLSVPCLPAYASLFAADERVLRLRRLWSKHHRRLAGAPFCRPYMLYVVNQPVTWQWPVTQAKPGILWYLPEELKTYNDHWLCRLWGSRQRSYQSTGVYGQLFELLSWLRLPACRYPSLWARYVPHPHQYSLHLAYAAWKKALPAPSLLSVSLPPAIELRIWPYLANLLDVQRHYPRAAKFARVPFAQKCRFFFFFTLQPELGSRFLAYTTFFQPWLPLYLWQRPYFFLRLTPVGDTVWRKQQSGFCLPEHLCFFSTSLDDPSSKANYLARLRSRLTCPTVSMHDYYKDYKQAFLDFYARIPQSRGAVSDAVPWVVFPPALKSLSTFFISVKVFEVRLSANNAVRNLFFPLRAGAAWEQRRVWEDSLRQLRAYKTVQTLAKKGDCLFLYSTLKTRSSCAWVSRLYTQERLRKLSTMHSQVAPNFTSGQAAWSCSPWLLSYKWRAYVSPVPVSLNLRSLPCLTFQPLSTTFLKQWQAYVSYAACVASWGGAGNAHLQSLASEGLPVSELDHDRLILTRDQYCWKRGFFGVGRYSRFAFWDALTSATFRAYLATPGLKRAYSIWWWESFYRNWPCAHWLVVNLSLKPRVLAYCFWVRQYPSSLKGLINLYGVCLESPELVPQLPWKLKRQLLPEEHVSELRALRKKKIFSQSWRSRW